mgnify:CR=1 FL=1
MNCAISTQQRREQQKEKFSFRSYITFYTRFPIPWWLFIASLVFSLINTEVFLAISKYVIQINKGELYNGVIIGYALLTVLNAAISMGSNICGEAPCRPGGRSDNPRCVWSGRHGPHRPQSFPP